MAEGTIGILSNTQSSDRCGQEQRLWCMAQDKPCRAFVQQRFPATGIPHLVEKTWYCISTG